MMTRAELRGRLLELRAPAPGVKVDPFHSTDRFDIFPEGTRFRYHGEDREFVDWEGKKHRGMVCYIHPKMVKACIDVSGIALTLLQEA